MLYLSAVNFAVWLMLTFAKSTEIVSRLVSVDEILEQSYGSRMPQDKIFFTQLLNRIKKADDIKSNKNDWSQASMWQIINPNNQQYMEYKDGSITYLDMLPKDHYDKSGPNVVHNVIPVLVLRSKLRSMYKAMNEKEMDPSKSIVPSWEKDEFNVQEPSTEEPSTEETNTEETRTEEPSTEEPSTTKSSTNRPTDKNDELPIDIGLSHEHCS